MATYSRFMQKGEFMISNGYIKSSFETSAHHTFTLGKIAERKFVSHAHEEFKGYFSPSFHQEGIIFSSLVSETEIAVDDLVGNGKCANFFGNTAEDLERYRLAGSQFLAICMSEKIHGHISFFVLTRGDNMVAKDLSNVVVAGVYIENDGRRFAFIRFIWDDHVWLSCQKLRIFYPATV